MEGENGSERENKCKLTPRYEKTPGSRVPREEKPAIEGFKMTIFGVEKIHYIKFPL